MHIEQKFLFPLLSATTQVSFPGDNQYDQFLMEPFGGLQIFI